jgi:hypothetical protein
MLRNGTGKAIVTIIGAFFVMALFFGNALLGAAFSNGGRNPVFGSNSTLNLSSTDVHGSARLTRNERDAAVALCISKVVHTPISSGGTIRISGTVSDLRKKRTEEATPACDCVINQVEDRSSKLQFLMVMDAIAKANTLFFRRGSPEFSRFWDHAQKAGMNYGEFQAAGRQIERIMASTIDTCSKHLSGR